MNKTLFSTLIAISLLCVNVSAQKTPQYFLSKIPALPRNICEANNKEIMQWNDKIIMLKNEMLSLKADEKQKKEEAEVHAKPRMDMFEPANADKIQKLGEEIQVVETETNAIQTELISPFIENQSNIELKYYGMLDKFEQRINKCREISAARADYLTNYRNKLDKLIELGIKGNKLSDEMTTMSYAGYAFRTQYGFWLDFILSYVDELSHVYDDVPTSNTEKH
ncbi:MAG: hypothetical protein KBB61_06855 [Paludibacteraceae bacterium]|jgi:hypothetical protein|nr:hypothetical protein [Paludibacteraceae bacterium]HNV95973.1 hypothetical protein [Bacteroidales bacterium]